MATQLRRIPTGAESPTVKFLFSVIKQLETKTVAWQTVADENGITNGHAARMRFSRLKAQVEGTAPYGRADKGDGTPRKKRKIDVRTERKLEAERVKREEIERGDSGGNNGGDGGDVAVRVKNEMGGFDGSLVGGDGGAIGGGGRSEEEARGYGVGAELNEVVHRNPVLIDNGEMRIKPEPEMD